MNPSTSGGNFEVNFVPAWHARAISRRKATRRQWMIIAVLIAAMGFAVIGARYRRDALVADLGRINERLAVTTDQVAQVERLRDDRDQLIRQSRIHHSLARPIRFTQVTASLVALMPEALSLTEIRMFTDLAERRDGSSGDGSSAAHPAPVIRVELAGRAPTNVMVANYVGALAGSPLFVNVKMLHSRQTQRGALVIRQFRVSMDVALDVDYVSPSSAGGPFVEAAEPGEADHVR